jgi:uncharacterized damage-inducible protein DinB
MLEAFLKNAILRHLKETELYLKTLQEFSGESFEDLVDKNEIKPDSILFKIPAKGIRPLGEVILHIIRSLEYYMRGIMDDHWEALPYNLVELNTIPEIVNLYQSITKKFNVFLEKLSADKLKEVITNFSRPASKAELLLEMIEHSIHHRGQISVYFRLLNIEPPIIKYII